jgi:hypothetical protein
MGATSEQTPAETLVILHRAGTASVGSMEKEAAGSPACYEPAALVEEKIFEL